MSTFDDILALSGKKLSEDQRRAVDSDVATVVSAGAGSGKTTVLSFRFLRLVCSGVDADRILTITFTKKAASEMYERIYTLLSLAAAKDAPDSYLNKQLRDNFNKAAISTMDSFWSEIARSGCLKYGIDRNFSILSDDELAELVDKIVDRLAFDENFFEEYDYIASNKKQSEIYEIFEKIAFHINVLADLNRDDIEKGIHDLISILKKEKASPDLLKCYLDQIGSYREYSNDKGFFADGTFDKAIESFSEGDYAKLPKFNIVTKAVSNSWEELKGIVKLYREALVDVQNIWLLENSIDDEMFVSKLIIAFAKEFNKEKRKAGLLTFSDVEALAKDILLHDKGIRSYYKDCFDYIMVDEFQDNNNEQKNLLYLLSEKKDIFTEGIPRAEDLDCKKLFLVGDDKQSIYRFRGADVSVFNNLKDEVVKKMKGAFLTLGDNYRSERKLVEHFNQVFSFVFSDSGDEDKSFDERVVDSFTSSECDLFEASAGSIRAGRGEGPVDPVIELDLLDDDDESDDTGLLSKTDSEAEFIANKILAIMEDPRFLIAENGQKRKPRFDDIGVLYSMTKTQMPIERALRKKGIPYTVVESTSSMLEGLAYDFYSFLQLLVYPDDKKSYIEILFSPFARISNEGMALFIDPDKDKEFIAFDETPHFSNPSDAESFAFLHDFYNKCKLNAGRETIAKTLERIYYESGYRTYLVSSPSLAVYDEHFSYLWALASKIDSEGGNIVDFLDFIRKRIGTAEKLRGIDIQRLEADGVKLMTVHKSKGLEFPIVILASAGTVESDKECQNSIIDTVHDGKPFVHYDIINSDYIAQKGFSGCDVKSKPIATPFNRYNRKRVVSEYKRILYVALTRAINHLVITAITYPFETKKGDESAKISLYRIYKEALDKVGQDKVSIEYFSRFSLQESLSSRSGHKDLRDMSWYEKAHLAKEATWNDVKVGVKEISHEEYESKNSYSGDLLPDFLVEDILNAHPDIRADFGTLVHSSLESLVSNVSVREFSNRNIGELDALRLSKEAERISLDFKKSSFYERFISNSNKQSAEVRFYYPYENRILEGSADLVVFRDDYNLVVDYKTDRHRNPEEHKMQITMYAKALEELYKKTCYGIVCYVRDFSCGPIWDRDGNEIDLPL